jgi:hypothetical protein
MLLYPCCTPKSLPSELWNAAAATATKINPLNSPNIEHLASLMPGVSPPREFISVVTTKYWHTKGVNLTVGFLDGPTQSLKDKILANMNAWGTS